METMLSEKACIDRKTTVITPVFRHCGGKVMVVIDNKRRYEGITEESIERCKAEEISFCTVLSDCKLYDLIEQKEKEITYVTYPNYHDETYADWSFK